MNVKVERGSTLSFSCSRTYVASFPRGRGWGGGGGGGGTVLQFSRDGDDRMGPLFHVRLCRRRYKRPAVLNLFLVLC